MEPDHRVVQLIARVLSGEADEAEVRWLQQWVEESPDHERVYRALTSAWGLAGRWPTAPATAPQPSVAAIVAEAERRRRTEPSAPRLGWRRTGLAAAALLVVAFGLRAVFDAGARTVVADGAVPLTVPLDDGSVIRLAPGARLTVPRARRTVELEGRAFFAVATDSTAPFVVRAGAARAEVLGTRFELAPRGDSLRLVVVEGRVALVAGGGRVEVASGHVSWAVRGRGPTPPRADDVWNLLEWPGGLLVFLDTPLADALREIARQFGVALTIRDSSVARRTVTAWFDEGESLNDVVSTVCLVVGASCTVGESIEVAR